MEQHWTWASAIAPIKNFFSRLRLLVLLLVFGCFLTQGCLAAYADTSPINPQLREQVLQIIRENPEVILEAVQVYQQQQQEQKQQVRQSFLQQMQQTPKAVIGASPTKGAANGRILLVEFSDFQCPFCARAVDTVNEFIQKHGDRVTLVYKHLPLSSIHAQALPAAKAAWAAGQQGKFWEFHDALFTNQGQLGESLYESIAKSLGLDLQRFNRDRASQAAEKFIQQDLQLAETLGVEGTPFFVMNGKVLAGAVSLADFEAALPQLK